MTQQSNRKLRRVLLVDDDPLVVKVYAERMKYEGWRVAIARDGWEASQEAKREHFDVVLLDIRMPFSDGLDVLREIRSGGKNEETPVWILTSLSSGEQIEDSLRLGADGVFHKSMTRPDDLVVELEKIFSGTKVGAGVGAEPHRPAGTASIADLEEGDFEFESFRAEAEEAGDAEEAAPADEGGEEEPATADGDEAGEGLQDGRVFHVYVNPFLGDGREFGEALGVDASYQCRVCGGQICLRILAYPAGRGHEIGGALACSRCEEPV